MCFYHSYYTIAYFFVNICPFPFCKRDDSSQGAYPNKCTSLIIPAQTVQAFHFRNRRKVHVFCHSSSFVRTACLLLCVPTSSQNIKQRLVLLQTVQYFLWSAISFRKYKPQLSLFSICTATSSDDTE